MELDDRSTKILEALIDTPSASSKNMEMKYHLTRRQLGYSFDKINDWLLEQNLPVIERTRQGRFIIDKLVFTSISGEQAGASSDSDVLSEDERVMIIVMMLLSHHDLSLAHFTSELAVSKNTVLSDLKLAQSRVETYGLTIDYSRPMGYVLNGQEFQIRKLLIHLVDKLLERAHGTSLLTRVVAIRDGEIAELNRRIKQFESQLNLQFTDEKVASMPYTLVLVLRRIRQGNRTEPFYIKYEELFDTEEYKATEKILDNVAGIPMEERLFITLHLLTTNVYWSAYLVRPAWANSNGCKSRV